jgi:hypothetical protein
MMIATAEKAAAGVITMRIGLTVTMRIGLPVVG